jgi:hypothetical protein
VGRGNSETRIHHASILTLLAAAAAADALQQAPAATPLNDLGSGLYLNQFEGGLYPSGSNEMPAAHAAEGIASAAAIRPLGPSGVAASPCFGGAGTFTLKLLAQI